MAARSKIGLHLRLVEMRMVKADRIRAEKAVEIDQAVIVRGVVKIGAVAFFEINDDPKTVEQDVFGDLLEDAVISVRLWFSGSH